MEYLSFFALLSFRHQLHHLHDFLHLNIVPYIPTRRLHKQLLSVPVCIHPDVVDAIDRDYLATLYDTRLVGNLVCYPSHRLTITFCCLTCLIPTYIKFGVHFDKMDVLNKTFPCVIKFVAQIVTSVSFLFWCVRVAEFFYHFYLGPLPIVYPLCNFIIILRTHLPTEINYATGYTPDTILYNASIMENNFRELHRFKTMAI